MGYGGSSGTGTVREKGCDLDDYPVGTPEDHIKNPIHQPLIEIMHGGAGWDIPSLHSRDINLVTKYVNEVNKVLKCILVRNVSKLMHVGRTSDSLVCEKGWCQHRLHDKQKGNILETDHRKGYLGRIWVELIIGSIDDGKMAVPNWNENWKRNIE